MSELTLDTAIKHCLEVAGEQQKRADSAELIDILDGLDVEACRECATEHRQLAEWLTELKEAKRLLKAAVEGMRWLNENTQDSYGSCTIRTEHGCSGCPFDTNGDLFCKWKHEAEALALIGQDGDTNG